MCFCDLPIFADFHELKSLSYYDAARLSAHGVELVLYGFNLNVEPRNIKSLCSSYCVDDRASLSADRRLARIQLRYVSSETNSTCATASTPAIQIGKRRSLTTCLTPPQTVHKHTRTANAMTPRRSPRKHPGTPQGIRTSARKLARRLCSDRRKRLLSVSGVRKKRVSLLKAQSTPDSGYFKSKDVKSSAKEVQAQQCVSGMGRRGTVSATLQMKRSERHKQVNSVSTPVTVIVSGQISSIFAGKVQLVYSNLHSVGEALA